jgi:5-methylcytosine-specific restriction endonuclease McrA
MLNSYPSKPCKHCGKLGHWPYQCFKNPKKRETLKPVGKYTKQWLITRKTWIKNNPPNHQGYWVCYLQIHENCPKFLTERTITLDHVVARTKDPSKRFDKDNLKPACAWCNELKGSKPLDEVL